MKLKRRGGKRLESTSTEQTVSPAIARELNVRCDSKREERASECTTDAVSDRLPLSLVEERLERFHEVLDDLFTDVDLEPFFLVSLSTALVLTGCCVGSAVGLDRVGRFRRQSRGGRGRVYIRRGREPGCEGDWGGDGSERELGEKRSIVMQLVGQLGYPEAHMLLSAFRSRA